jgi:hypothetical protein
MIPLPKKHAKQSAKQPPKKPVRYGLDELKAALATGIVFAALYIIWVLAIGLGGQAAMNLFTGLEVIRLPSPRPISLAIPFVGLVVNFALGAFGGWLFARLWNRLKV